MVINRPKPITGETETQTHIQCYPFYLQGDEEASVLTNHEVQTEISIDPSELNADIYPRLTTLSSADLYRDAQAILELPKKKGLKFVLPRSKKESILIEGEEVEEKTINLTGEGEEEEDKEEDKEEKEYDEEEKEVEIFVGKILEEQLETFLDKSEARATASKTNKKPLGEKKKISPKKKEPEESKSADNKPASTEKTKAENTVKKATVSAPPKTKPLKMEEKEVELPKSPEEGLISPTKSLLKRRLVLNTNGEELELPDEPGVPFEWKKREVSCQEAQTDLSVKPHIIDEDEQAVVSTDLGTQTSVMCLPQDSTQDILPKLKIFMEHPGIELAPRETAYGEGRATIMEIIQELISNASKEHEKMLGEVSARSIRTKAKRIPGQPGELDITSDIACLVGTEPCEEICKQCYGIKFGRRMGKTRMTITSSLTTTEECECGSTCLCEKVCVCGTSTHICSCDSRDIPGEGKGLMQHDSQCPCSLDPYAVCACHMRAIGKGVCPCMIDRKAECVCPDKYPKKDNEICQCTVDRYAKCICPGRPRPLLRSTQSRCVCTLDRYANCTCQFNCSNAVGGCAKCHLAECTCTKEKLEPETCPGRRVCPVECQLVTCDCPPDFHDPKTCPAMRAQTLIRTLGLPTWWELEQGIIKKAKLAEKCTCPDCACPNRKRYFNKFIAGHPADCTCKICSCIGKDSSCIARSLQKHPDDCSCSICTCPIGEHPSDCGCFECRCLRYGDEMALGIRPKMDHPIHCTCFFCQEKKKLAREKMLAEMRGEDQEEDQVEDQVEEKTEEVIVLEEEPVEEEEIQEHGSECDCEVCRCHPPNCSCLICKCAELDKKMKQHKPDCKCGDCVCSFTSPAHKIKSKYSSNILSEKRDRKETKRSASDHLSTCDCDVCTCLTTGPVRRKIKHPKEATLNRHPSSCDCLQCACDREETEQIKSPKPLPVSKHQSECDCPVCSCGPIKSKEIKAVNITSRQSSKHSSECNCEDCRCYEQMHKPDDDEKQSDCTCSVCECAEKLSLARKTKICPCQPHSKAEICTCCTCHPKSPFGSKQGTSLTDSFTSDISAKKKCCFLSKKSSKASKESSKKKTVPPEIQKRLRSKESLHSAFRSPFTTKQTLPESYKSKLPCLVRPRTPSPTPVGSRASSLESSRSRLPYPPPWFPCAARARSLSRESLRPRFSSWECNCKLCRCKKCVCGSCPILQIKDTCECFSCQIPDLPALPEVRPSSAESSQSSKKKVSICALPAVSTCSAADTNVKRYSSTLSEISQRSRTSQREIKGKVTRIPQAKYTEVVKRAVRIAQSSDYSKCAANDMTVNFFLGYATESIKSEILNKISQQQLLDKEDLRLKVILDLPEQCTSKSCIIPCRNDYKTGICLCEKCENSRSTNSTNIVEVVSNVICEDILKTLSSDDIIDINEMSYIIGELFDPLIPQEKCSDCGSILKNIPKENIKIIQQTYPVKYQATTKASQLKKSTSGLFFFRNVDNLKIEQIHRMDDVQEPNLGIEITPLPPQLTEDGFTIPLKVTVNGMNYMPPCSGSKSSRSSRRKMQEDTDEDARDFNESMGDLQRSPLRGKRLNTCNIVMHTPGGRKPSAEVQTVLALGGKIQSESLNSFPETDDEYETCDEVGRLKSGLDGMLFTI